MTTQRVSPLPALALLLAGAGGWATANGQPDPQGPGGPAQVTNSLGMVFVRMAPARFTMGNGRSVSDMAALFPRADKSRLEALVDEQPAHEVVLTATWYMGQHEVTVGQFEQFLQRSGYVPQSVADGTGGYGYNPAYDPRQTSRGDAFEGRSPRYSWRNPGFPQTAEHPVVNVTWHDAQAMAQWLSRLENRRYRLPTEAEWEYACRAGRSGPDPDDGHLNTLRATANTFDQGAATHWSHWAAEAVPWNDGHPFTAPVGRFQPNALGLHDMLGNVWEWTADWHSDTYYAESPRENPQGPDTGHVKVRRGGSWHTWPLYARCTYRNWNSPETRYTLVGMRLVLEAP
jgi:formylglycine-generating enzyme required for sulfatase activity